MSTTKSLIEGAFILLFVVLAAVSNAWAEDDCWDQQSLPDQRSTALQEHCVINEGNVCYDIVHSAVAVNNCGKSIKLHASAGTMSTDVFLGSGHREMVHCLESENNCSGVIFTLIEQPGTGGATSQPATRPLGDAGGDGASKPDSDDDQDLSDLLEEQQLRTSQATPLAQRLKEIDDQYKAALERRKHELEEVRAQEAELKRLQDLNRQHQEEIRRSMVKPPSAFDEQSFGIESVMSRYSPEMQAKIRSCVIGHSGCNTCDNSGYGVHLNCNNAAGLQSAIQICSPVCGIR